MFFPAVTSQASVFLLKGRNDMSVLHHGCVFQEPDSALTLLGELGASWSERPRLVPKLSYPSRGPKEQNVSQLGSSHEGCSEHPEGRLEWI